MSCLHCGDWYRPERGDDHYSCKRCSDKWFKIGEQVEKERKEKGLEVMEETE
jgi:DNA-directed RNA polymerase subunit RPC12/RpoP